MSFSPHAAHPKFHPLAMTERSLSPPTSLAGRFDSAHGCRSLPTPYGFDSAFATPDQAILIKLTVLPQLALLMRIAQGKKIQKIRRQEYIPDLKFSDLIQAAFGLSLSGLSHLKPCCLTNSGM
jgi:hypothetical protein